MRNTIILAVLLFLGVIAASIYYFSGLNREQHNTLKPLKYLPENTFLIASIKNDEVTDNIFKDFDLFDALLGKKDISLLKRYKNQLLRHDALYDYIAEQDVFLSFHPDKDSLNLLITIPTSENISESQLASLINQFAKHYKIGSVDTLGNKITTLSFGNPDTTLYTTYYQHVLFASSSLQTIVSALNKSIPKLSEKQIDYFIHNNSKNTPFSVYFPHQNFQALVKHFQQKEKGFFLDQFLGLEGQSTWNINFKQDALMLTGESQLQQTQGNYIALFRYQSKRTQRLYNFFPSNTAVFMEYSLSSYPKFASDLKEYFEARQETKKVASLLENLDKENSSLHKLIATWQHNFAVVEMTNQSQLAFVALNDTTAWKDVASSLLEDAGDNIYRFKTSNILYSIYGEPFKNMSRPYVTRVQDVLVISNILADLRYYRNSYDRKDLLTGTLGFKNFEKLQGNEANVTLFIHNKNAYSKILYSLPAKYQKKFRDDENYGFKDFYSWSLQLSGNNGTFGSQLYALYKSKNALGGTPEWSYPLANKAITAPYVFEHSDSTQFILIQELDHTLHAIHPSGTKMWSTVISGRIVGEIKQLEDRSIIFVTDKNRLYRLDTDGKNKKGFSRGLSDTPVAAPLAATAAGKEVLLVPTKNKILAIDLDGNMIEEWKNITADGTLLGEVQQIGKEFVIASSYGRIYFINQDGSLRKEIDIPGDVEFRFPLGVVDKGNNSYELLAYATNHTLYRIAEDKVVDQHTFDSKANRQHVDFINIAGSSAPEMILIHDNRLQFVDIAKKDTLYEYHFTKNIDDKPQYFRDGRTSNSLIGVASKATNLIYLFSGDNTLIEGFPVEGLPLFYYGKINYNSEIFLLCTRRDKKLYAFKHQK